MASTATIEPISEPFPIFRLAHRYLLYDANTIAYIRQHYNICGVLIGSLPQAPQQNVFLGLPLGLTPEEARLLVEKEVAYIVDDAKAHKRAYLDNGLSLEERKAYQAALRKQGASAARESSKKTDERKKAALKKKMGTENWNDIPKDMLKHSEQQRKVESATDASQPSSTIEDEDESLFASPMNSFPSIPAQSDDASHTSSNGPDPWAITPTTSYLPLQTSAPLDENYRELPDTNQSYPLFKHLHEKGYFLAPGLRFGCQFMAYPGDPLRFHSHFLCNGMDWDQEFDLIDLVGGGRLGTGVKKGFLIGGQEDMRPGLPKSHNNEDQDGVRTFCIEWGGM